MATENLATTDLPAIPAKRYFTIGEVSELCGVKPYVLRYWEQEFSQLKPMKRRGNRRYYQHHDQRRAQPTAGSGSRAWPARGRQCGVACEPDGIRTRPARWPHIRRRAR